MTLYIDNSANPMRFRCSRCLEAHPMPKPAMTVEELSLETARLQTKHLRCKKAKRR